MILKNPKLKLFFVVSVLSTLALTACQAGENGVTQAYPTGESLGTVQAADALPPSIYPTPEPYAFPTSEKGTITLHGRLVVKNPFAMAPDPVDPVFLVPLAGDPASISSIPPFEIGEVPRATVDITNGEFAFADIEPGQYALVVLLTSGSQIPAKFMSNGNLAILTLTAADIDQVVEIEPVSVP